MEGNHLDDPSYPLFVSGLHQHSNDHSHLLTPRQLLGLLEVQFRRCSRELPQISS